MGLSTYLRAVAVRWVWVLVAGLVGLIGAGALSTLSTPEYVARASLYVTAVRVDGEDGRAYAARIQDEVVPSVARLARSGAVLEQVVGRLELPVSAGRLAERITVAVADDTNLLDVIVSDSVPARAARTADAVANQVVARTSTLLTGPSGPLLRLSLVQPAAVPRFPDAPGALISSVAGAGGGLGLAMVGAGLAELARRRIRGRRDVGEVTSAPVLAQLPPSPHPDRGERLGTLRTWLASVERAGRPVFLVDASPNAAGTALAAELGARVWRAGRVPGTGLVPFPADRAGVGESEAGVVAVVDGRGSTREDLANAVTTIQTGGLRPLGVVIDGVLPARASMRARLRAGRRGDASEWIEERLPERSASPSAAASMPTRVIAVLAIGALGFSRELPMGLTTGLLAVVALLPVWLPVLRRYRGATPLVALTGLSLGAGMLLAWFSSGDHEFARYEAVSTAVVVVTFAGGTGLVLWARTVLPLPTLGVAFGMGALAAGMLAVPGSENPLKFQLSFPIAVIVLSLLAGRNRPVASVTALLALGAMNVIGDHRSALAFAAVSVALILWQTRPRRRPTPWWVQLALLGVIASGGYWVLRELLLAGALGPELQERTATQIAQTGSLLLGGRPEWTATWALMQDRPIGFGLGTVPSSYDVLVAEQGISVTRIPTVQGYLENYLLDGRFELHSIIADLWANLGAAGIALGLTAGALIVIGLAAQLSRRQAPGLVCYLASLTLWSLAFGPLPTGLPKLTLALGLLLIPALGAADASPVDPAPPDEYRFDSGRAAGRPQPVAS